MAKKRHHSSSRMHGMKEHYSSGMDHHSDEFNDERKHGKDGRMGMMGFHTQTFAENYAGMEPRRRQELEDAGMIREDHSQIANLPQQVMMKPYPKTGPYLPEGLDDTITSIDDQMDYDDSQRRKHFYPKKV